MWQVLSFSDSSCNVIDPAHSVHTNIFSSASAELMVWGLCPASGVRVAIISEPIEQIHFKFQLWFPMDHTPKTFFEFLKKKMHFQMFEDLFFVFVLIVLTWDPMGAQNSKRYSALKSLLNLFKLFLNFLLSGPHKSTIWDFWKFEFLIFQDFFSFSLTWDSVGAKSSKRYSSHKSLRNPLKLFLNFLVSSPQKKYCFGISKLWVFETSCFRKVKVHHCTLWIN